MTLKQQSRILAASVAEMNATLTAFTKPGRLTLADSLRKTHGDKADALTAIYDRFCEDGNRPRFEAAKKAVFEGGLWT